MKALNKKIRQVEELEAKVAAGGVVPTEDQRQKLSRKPALLAELAEVTSRAGCRSLCRDSPGVESVNARGCSQEEAAPLLSVGRAVHVGRGGGHVYT